MPPSKAPRAQSRPVDVKSILHRQIGDTLRALRQRETFSDETVHFARKELKRARASLRLLRDAIGKSAYARLNAELRDIARPLGRARDAKVMNETVDRLLAPEKNKRRRAVLLKLRAELREARLSLRRELLQDSGGLDRTDRSLARAQRRVERWHIPVNKADFSVQSGLERIYRQGRKALAKAHSDGSDINLHELRKQVKYLGQAMNTFEPIKARRLASVLERASAMAECLGDDHDLALLQERLAAHPGGSLQVRKALHAQMQQRRDRLQKKALKRGRSVYGTKPAIFIKRFQALA